MRERVNVVLGKQPVLFVAPHGSDDINTAIIAKEAADVVGAYAVINQGFERSNSVDVDNDKADCNRVDHCKQAVVYDEFLKPIERSRNKFASNIRPKAIEHFVIFYIHGAGDIVHSQAKDNVGVIVGYGLGLQKDSLTCKAWRKNLFVSCWRHHREFATDDYGDAFEGTGGGKYAGRSTNNLNQYFRKHVLDRQVDCMQLEFPFSLRKTEDRAANTGLMLGLVVKDLLGHDTYDNSSINSNSRFI